MTNSISTRPPKNSEAILPPGQHGALDERFVLAQVAGNVVQEPLDAVALEMERRPGQKRLDLGDGVPGLGEQARIIRADPGRDQHDQAVEYDRDDEQGYPGRGERRQPGPAQSGCQRLQQGGEQQRHDARHHHDGQQAEHARHQVNGGGENEQPPGPSGAGLQPARHPAGFRRVSPSLRHHPGPLRRSRTARSRTGQPVLLTYVRAAIDLGLDALAARDQVFFCLAVAAVLRPRVGAGTACAAQCGRVVRHDRMATAAITAETPGQRTAGSVA
jgi:hypothetical protein